MNINIILWRHNIYCYLLLLCPINNLLIAITLSFNINKYIEYNRTDLLFINDDNRYCDVIMTLQKYFQWNQFPMKLLQATQDTIFFITILTFHHGIIILHIKLHIFSIEWLPELFPFWGEIQNFTRVFAILIGHLLVQMPKLHIGFRWFGSSICDLVGFWC